MSFPCVYEWRLSVAVSGNWVGKTLNESTFIFHETKDLIPKVVWFPFPGGGQFFLPERFNLPQPKNCSLVRFKVNFFVDQILSSNREIALLDKNASFKTDTDTEPV